MQEVKSASVEKDQNDIEWENNTNPIFVDFPQDEICIDIRNVNLWYGQKQALYNVDMPVRRNKITALIGPSGCGKSTLLRSINRMNDLVDGCRIEGEMLFHGDNLYAPDVDMNSLRTRIGMIFQKPNPFPMTIRENITYGPKIHGIKDKKELNEIVERCLQQAALYDEVADRLDTSALGLSGGQQQRLCIARALSVNPEVILMDAHRHLQDRGSGSGAQEGLHRCHRHPQHAAGVPYRGLHRLHVPGQDDRVQRDRSDVQQAGEGYD